MAAFEDQAAAWQAVYGKVDRATGRVEWLPTGAWTVRGKTAYFWCTRWPGRELAIGGLRTTVKGASLVPSGKKLKTVLPFSPSSTSVMVSPRRSRSTPVQRKLSGNLVPFRGL